MDVKIKRVTNLKDEPVEQDDLVKRSFWGEEYFGIVVKLDSGNYNIIIIEKEADELDRSQVYIEFSEGIPYNRLIDEYELVAKSKDYEIVINYKG